MRGVTGEELLLIASMSASGLIWGSMSLALPLYLKDLGLSPFEIGVLISSYMLVGAMAGLFVSALADAYGRRKFFLVGRLASALAFLGLYERVPYTTALVMGLGGGSLMALLAEKAKDLDRDLSWSQAASTALAVAGASVPWIVGLRRTMLFDSAVSLASLMLVIPVRESYRGTGRFELRIKSIGHVAKLSTDSLIGLGAGMILPLMPLWFSKRFDVGTASLSPVYMVSDSMLALGIVAAPWLGRRLGRVRTIVLTHAAGIALLIALPFSPSYEVAAAIFVIRNVAMNMSGPLFGGLVMNIIPPEERARGESLLNLIDGLPRSMGPSLTGYIFTQGNLSLPFFITAGLYTAATAAFYVFFKDFDRRS